jgi:hypothetical protein
LAVINQNYSDCSDELPLGSLCIIDSLHLKDVHANIFYTKINKIIVVSGKTAILACLALGTGWLG